MYLLKSIITKKTYLIETYSLNDVVYANIKLLLDLY